MIKIYTDGSCMSNPGNGGWAAIININGEIKKISGNEKKYLNILCKGAALRYLLTRVYDYLNTPKNAVIKIKDPKEYIQKLKIHNKFNNFKNYYS